VAYRLLGTTFEEGKCGDEAFGDETFEHIVLEIF
jgi:hypothetical protein